MTRIFLISILVLILIALNLGCAIPPNYNSNETENNIEKLKLAYPSDYAYTIGASVFDWKSASLHYMSADSTEKLAAYYDFNTKKINGETYLVPYFIFIFEKLPSSSYDN